MNFAFLLLVSFVSAGIIYFSVGPPQAQPKEYRVFQDDTLDVSCWETRKGLSCIPNWMLLDQALPYMPSKPERN